MADDLVRVRLRAYDHQLLDQAVRRIVEIISPTGATIPGPAPLPATTHRYTVMRPPKFRTAGDPRCGRLPLCRTRS